MEIASFRANQQIGVLVDCASACLEVDDIKHCLIKLNQARDIAKEYQLPERFRAFQKLIVLTNSIARLDGLVQLPIWAEDEFNRS